MSDDKKRTVPMTRAEYARFKRNLLTQMRRVLLSCVYHHPRMSTAEKNQAIRVIGVK